MGRLLDMNLVDYDGDDNAEDRRMTRSVSWTQTGRAGAPTPQASREAFEWYRRAAEQGHLDAQFAMSVMYEQGKGIDSNPGHALFWVRKAAEQGHPGRAITFGCRL